jgi:hypothetical protein
MILLISASWVARIIGVSHQRPVESCVFDPFELAFVVKNWDGSKSSTVSSFSCGSSPHSPEYTAKSTTVVFLHCNGYIPVDCFSLFLATLRNILPLFLICDCILMAISYFKTWMKIKLLEIKLGFSLIFWHSDCTYFTNSCCQIFKSQIGKHFFRNW